MIRVFDFTVKDMVYTATAGIIPTGQDSWRDTINAIVEKKMNSAAFSGSVLPVFTIRKLSEGYNIDTRSQSGNPLDAETIEAINQGFQSHLLTHPL